VRVRADEAAGAAVGDIVGGVPAEPAAAGIGDALGPGRTRLASQAEAPAAVRQPNPGAQSALVAQEVRQEPVAASQVRGGLVERMAS